MGTNREKRDGREEGKEVDLEIDLRTMCTSLTALIVSFTRATIVGP